MGQLSRSSITRDAVSIRVWSSNTAKTSRIWNTTAKNADVYTDLLPYAIVTAEDGTETALTLPEVLLPISDTTLVQRKTLIRDFTLLFR